MEISLIFYSKKLITTKEDFENVSDSKFFIVATSSGAIVGSSMAVGAGKGKIILMKSKGKEALQVPYLFLQFED